MKQVKQTVKLIMAGSLLSLFALGTAYAADMKDCKDKMNADCNHEMKADSMQKDKMMKSDSMSKDGMMKSDSMQKDKMMKDDMMKSEPMKKDGM